MKQYTKGLVIGRFQPFHLGHKYLLEQALKKCERIVIGIGSSNRYDDDNPISYKKRESIVNKFLQKEGMNNRVEKIFPAADVPDDNEWFKLVTKQTGKIDAVIGNNAWVNGIFLGKKYKIVEVPYYRRNILEGTKIRKLVKEKKHWEDRVPQFLVTAIRDELT